MTPEVYSLFDQDRLLAQQLVFAVESTSGEGFIASAVGVHEVDIICVVASQDHDMSSARVRKVLSCGIDVPGIHRSGCVHIIGCPHDLRRAITQVLIKRIYRTAGDIRGRPAPAMVSDDIVHGLCDDRRKCAIARVS